MDEFPQYDADRLMKTTVRRFRWLEQEAEAKRKAREATQGMILANVAGNGKAYDAYAKFLDESGW